MIKKTIFLTSFISFLFCQWFTLNQNGTTRTYYVSYPENLEIGSAPLIINMHGFGGNASQQMSYTQMDQYAHNQNIAVVYPQGLNNSWNVYTYWDSNPYDDVEFINIMIDDISENFDIDLDRIYACGMSNGGYMAYRLACDLSDEIAAFGSVTGNFMINNEMNDCLDQGRKIPIIHFHGTSDPIVNYYSPSFDGSLTVEESISFWSEYNDLSTELIETINSNVEVYTYSNNTGLEEFVHYKVYGGGHEWFYNNWGFNTSEKLVDFFQDFKLSDFTQVMGDLNNDGVINIQDVVLIINIILNQEYITLGDINNDTYVDVIDIVLLVSIILSVN